MKRVTQRQRPAEAEPKRSTLKTEPKRATPKAVYQTGEFLDPGYVRPQAWEIFFRCQKNPVLRSLLLTALLSKTRMETERIPTASLLDALLMATAAREYCEAEIVDDYLALLQRVQDTWSKPDWCTKVFCSIHGSMANFILNGSRQFTEPESKYVPDFVTWYIEQDDCPNYFARELGEDEVVGVQRTTAKPTAKPVKIAKKGSRA